MSNKKGKFIVFEGLDGAGTTTQMMLLKRWLSERGICVELTKEPSNGPFGAVIRQAIEDRICIDPIALALAFASDRVDHLYNNKNGIKAILEKGVWVISDRYLLSNLAYQGSLGVEIEWLISINKFAIEPDLTIFIDTKVDVCLDRLNLRSSHLELFHEGPKLKMVMDKYLEIIDGGHFLGELILVNGDNSEEGVFMDIMTRFLMWLEKIDF